jgi:hypothetical protein
MISRIQPVLMLVACALLLSPGSAPATPLLTEEPSSASDAHDQAWIFDLPVDPQIGLLRITADGEALLASAQRNPSEAAAQLDDGLGFDNEQSLQGLVRSYMSRPHPTFGSVNPQSSFGDLLAPLQGAPVAAGVDEPEFINLSPRGADSFNPMVAEDEGVISASLKDSLLASMPSIEEDPLIAVQSAPGIGGYTVVGGYTVADLAAQAVAAIAALQAALPRNPSAADDALKTDNPRAPAAVQRDKSLSLGQFKPQSIFGLGYEMLTYPGTLLIALVLIALQLISHEGGWRFLLPRKRRRRRKPDVSATPATVNVSEETAPAAPKSAPSPFGRRRRRRSH